MDTSPYENTYDPHAEYAAFESELSATGSEPHMPHRVPRIRNAALVAASLARDGPVISPREGDHVAAARAAAAAVERRQQAAAAALAMEKDGRSPHGVGSPHRGGGGRGRGGDATSPQGISLSRRTQSLTTPHGPPIMAAKDPLSFDDDLAWSRHYRHHNMQDPSSSSGSYGGSVRTPDYASLRGSNRGGSLVGPPQPALSEYDDNGSVRSYSSSHRSPHHSRGGRSHRGGRGRGRGGRGGYHHHSRGGGGGGGRGGRNKYKGRKGRKFDRGISKYTEPASTALMRDVLLLNQFDFIGPHQVVVKNFGDVKCSRYFLFPTNMHHILPGI